eukprot:scaffold39643_cov71-Phaeocystis_antarctica.AAC.7
MRGFNQKPTATPYRHTHTHTHQHQHHYPSLINYTPSPITPCNRLHAFTPYPRASTTLVLVRALVLRIFLALVLFLALFVLLFLILVRCLVVRLLFSGSAGRFRELRHFVFVAGITFASIDVHHFLGLLLLLLLLGFTLLLLLLALFPGGACLLDRNLRLWDTVCSRSRHTHHDDGLLFLPFALLRPKGSGLALSGLVGARHRRLARLFGVEFPLGLGPPAHDGVARALLCIDCPCWGASRLVAVGRLQSRDGLIEQCDHRLVGGGQPGGEAIDADHAPALVSVARALAGVGGGALSTLELCLARHCEVVPGVGEGLQFGCIDAVGGRRGAVGFLLE